MTKITYSRWRCRCINQHGSEPCRVPPSPEVIAETFMEYRNSGLFAKMKFKKYLEYIGFTDPAANVVGMDDASRFVRSAAGDPQLLAIPSQPVLGELRVMVLLVEFPDKRGAKPAQHYKDMLFSDKVFPTGSMRDYYKEVSGGKVDIVGDVNGWLMMPQPYAYYTNGESGTKWESYPHNAPRLAEDAVQAALSAGVEFDASLDKFGQGMITVLFIVHAGRGAEVMPKALRKNEIWSHKWQLKTPAQLPSGLSATTYLAVPFDCKVGVCAHELGHLAFQWQDFYDPNYDEDGIEWDGTGIWDLMAGGSYNGDGARPAHPAALHKLQHGWITATKVTTSSSHTIKPFTAAGGRVLKVSGSAHKEGQYLLLECRAKRGFDTDLPGHGLLVWRVDEAGEQFSPAAPGLTLIQADGKKDLEDPDGWNQGDEGDPFPGSENIVSLNDFGDVSTSFDDKHSGISFKDIAVDSDGVVTLQIVIDEVGTSAPLKTVAVKTADLPRQSSKPKKPKPKG
jgi:immune inhibitor A